MQEPRPREVFISHTHSDAELANALNDALEELFGRDRVSVQYSTSKGDGGVPGGTDWFRWIVERVQRSDVTFVLLTPSSIQKPWIPWEAGAVYGSALSRGQDEAAEPGVLPLRFHISNDELPEPFRQLQVVNGDQIDDARKMFDNLLMRFKPEQPDAEWGRAFGRLDSAVKKYIGRVQEALARAPMTPTEATVQEWNMRLDDLRVQRRFSEAKQIHQWLELAFGRGADEQPRPLDLRIHRRLGELYHAGKDFPRAAEQFQLCRKTAPRDLFVLRALGQAYLEYDGEKAHRVIEEISELAPNAFEENAECAGLKGRWLRENDRLPDARDLYERALDHNPASYYLAGRLAHAKLDLGDPDAKQAFERVVAIIKRLDEQNVWTRAEAANAAVVAGLRDEAMAQLRAIAALGPTASEVESIKRGLRQLLETLGSDASELDGLSDALAGRA